MGEKMAVETNATGSVASLANATQLSEASQNGKLCECIISRVERLPRHAQACRGY